jgi:AcrR family transcriptional regulator
MSPTTARSKPDRPGPRERLLGAAEGLMYDQGVDVGVDAILKEADVARASLYQHFGDKDGLISAVLVETSAADLRRYRDALDAGGTEPRARLLSLFDAITAAIEREGYRGCRYTSASLALHDQGHPAHLAAHNFKADVRALMRAELERLDDPDPELTAVKLSILIDGAMSTAITQPDTRPGPVAREIAEAVIDRPRTTAGAGD